MRRAAEAFRRGVGATACPSTIPFEHLEHLGRVIGHNDGFVWRVFRSALSSLSLLVNDAARTEAAAEKSALKTRAPVDLDERVGLSFVVAH